MRNYVRPHATFEIFRDALEIYARHFVSILTAFSLTLPFAYLRDYVLVEDSFAGIALNHQIEIVAMILYEVVSVYIIVMTITIMVSLICRGKKPSLPRSFKRANHQGVRQMVFAYLILLAVPVGCLYLFEFISHRLVDGYLRWLLMITVGLLLLAFYALTMFVPCVIALEPERREVLENERTKRFPSFMRSIELGKGCYLRNLTIWIATNLLAWVTFFLLAELPLPQVADEVPHLLENVGMTLVAPVSSICTVLLYYDMRARKEGFDLRMLTDELHL
jgi:hypothetical protein